MAGGRLRLLSCSFTSAKILLHFLLLPSLDVDTYNCQKEFHKHVGDSVEFFPCFSTEDITYARWDFGNSEVDCLEDEMKHSQNVKMSCNQTTFSLTVRELTVQDSGTYQFISEGKEGNKPIVEKILKVNALFKPPDLIVSSTWNTSSNSCAVLLTCTSTSEDLVTYTWTMKNKIWNGSLLRYNLRPEENETMFNCTALSVQSGTSASSVHMVKCNNRSMAIPWLYLAAALSLIIIISAVVPVTVWCCKRKQKGVNECDQTVYADVSDCPLQSQTATTPESIYETVSDSGMSSSTTIACSVYDTIQLSRMAEQSSY